MSVGVSPSFSTFSRSMSTHGSPVHRFGDSGLLVRQAGGRTCQRYRLAEQEDRYRVRAANLARLASGGNATNESMRRSGAKRAERVGRGACEVYGALVERLTAKALRQMQHWTDIK
jgi:hypothetical protein